MIIYVYKNATKWLFAVTSCSKREENTVYIVSLVLSVGEIDS